MYVSKHWSVSEWDCWRRNKNVYAWDDEMGRLCTNDSKTEKLFRIVCVNVIRIGSLTLLNIMQNTAPALNPVSER